MFEGAYGNPIPSARALVSPEGIGQYDGQMSKSSAPTHGRATEQMTRIAKLTESLHAEISGLENRLDGVLRPVPPTPGTAQGSTGRPVSSQLASAAEEFGDRIEHAIVRLRDLSARVDL
jgi:hypothetical protein